MTIALLVSHWRTVAMAALIALVGTLGLAARHYHSEVSVARAAATAAQAEVATIRADAARDEAALTTVSAAAAAQAATDHLIRESINAAPPSTNCAQSAAMRALMLGLRDHPTDDASAGAQHAAHLRR